MKSFRLTMLTLLAALFTGHVTTAQVPTDSIVADFNYFVSLLEEMHPDPYTNYGGKPRFRMAATEARYGLIRDKVTDVREFAWLINEFLAPLQDGHTVALPDGHFVPGHFPIAYTDPGTQIVLEAINNGDIIVKALPQEYESLIGSRLIAVENMPIKELADGMAKHFIAENEIGRMMNLAHYAVQPKALRKVITNLGDESITYQLNTPKGKKAEVTLPVVPYNQMRQWQQQAQKSSIFPGKELDYDFLGMLQYGTVDDLGNTMYFHVAHMIARDYLDYYRDKGNYDECVGMLQGIYAIAGMPVPDNLDFAIAMIPSLSEEFEKMLQLMKQRGSKNLIVDLRGNGGGTTQICYPLLYMLFGDEYIKISNTFDRGYFEVTPRTVSKASLDQYNVGRDYKLQYGDYHQLRDEKPLDVVTEEARNQFIDGSMCSIKDKLRAQHGQPVYSPEHIYVLTDPLTYSAAFHLTFFLWKLGATVVGVPSSQAPNTFLGNTSYTLPRTRLSGDIDMMIQQYLPDDDPRAKVFTPDMTPTYEDYKRYNFDDNTIVLYLLDRINDKKK